MSTFPDRSVSFGNPGRLGVAFLPAFPVGWDREVASRGAGLRTFLLVAIVACGFALVGKSVFSSTEAESRVLQGVITGIGFVVGGAILKSNAEVRGSATATGIRITGAIGIAVALARFEIALVMALTSGATPRHVPCIKPAGEDAGDD